jgi:hypothetical protein
MMGFSNSSASQTNKASAPQPATRCLDIHIPLIMVHEPLRLDERENRVEPKWECADGVHEGQG